MDLAKNVVLKFKPNLDFENLKEQNLNDYYRKVTKEDTFVSEALRSFIGDEPKSYFQIIRKEDAITIQAKAKEWFLN